MLKPFPLELLKQSIDQCQNYRFVGKVSQVVGLTLEVQGLKAAVGELCLVIPYEGAESVKAEVVGFKEDKLLLMVLGSLNGIGPHSWVMATGKQLSIQVGDHLLGQILDGLGNPIDAQELKGESYSIDRDPPHPMLRKRIETVMTTGVRAIDGLLTIGEGQRMGIFAGSGVGKSTLLGMISRYGTADVNVICLIGERGREVKEFIERDLGESGMKNTVVICATSDQPALVRIKSAYVATTIAEYFRDQGKKVTLMMDSVTRFAMAQREIGLAIGEPPTTKGYTPSVFTLLPRLLERSGMDESGSITAFYTVLVDGGDLDEPIADAVRGILDGHIVLSRKLATQNHFPAIDVNQSISRLMNEIVSPEHREWASRIRNNLALYEKNSDLINIGAYLTGSSPQIDEAIRLVDPINQFLKQEVSEHQTMSETLTDMSELLTK